MARIAKEDLTQRAQRPEHIGPRELTTKRQNCSLDDEGGGDDAGFSRQDFVANGAGFDVGVGISRSDDGETKVFPAARNGAG